MQKTGLGAVVMRQTTKPSGQYLNKHDFCLVAVSSAWIGVCHLGVIKPHLQHIPRKLVPACPIIQLTRQTFWFLWWTLLLQRLKLTLQRADNFPTPFKILGCSSSYLLARPDSGLIFRPEWRPEPRTRNSTSQPEGTPGYALFDSVTT